MRRQVDSGRLGGVSEHPLVGEPLGGLVGADTIDDPAQQSVLGVGAIACEKDRVVAVFDHDGKLSGGVSRDRHEGYVACLRERHTRREGAEPNGRQVDQGRAKRGGPALVWVSAQAAAQSCGVLELSSRHQDLAGWEVVQAARMVGVEMGHYDAADIGRDNPELLELRADFLLRLHLLANGEPEERLPAREVTGLRDAGRLPGIDHDHALCVLDREGVDRKRLGPLAVTKRLYEPASAVARALPPLRRDRDGACLDCMDLHFASFFRSEEFACVAKRTSSSTTPSAYQPTAGTVRKRDHD